LFEGEKDLVLLCIDEKKVSSEIVYEDLYQAGEEYPHIYGPLDVEAVKDVYEFSFNEEGQFSLPEKLKEYEFESE